LLFLWLKNNQSIAAYLPCGLQKVIHRFAPALFTRNVDKPGDMLDPLCQSRRTHHYVTLNCFIRLFLIIFYSLTAERIAMTRFNANFNL